MSSQVARESGGASARIAILLTALTMAAPVLANDLTLHLRGAGSWTRTVVEYRCDAMGARLGLPAAAFSVEYINGVGNSLAVVPVSGSELIFVNVWSGSGARYVAREYVWWDAAGRTTTFRSESLAGGAQATCWRTQH
ncbi:MAG TPA: MliC family protein [Steroidobacteraceae bacterium]|nr:MliC family protein [Steroidobacteraceae bacterium]